MRARADSLPLLLSNDNPSGNNAQRPPDAGPWCACGDYRVPVPTMRCPVCVGVETAEHMAAVAAIGQSSRWGGHGFGRKGNA